MPAANSTKVHAELLEGLSELSEPLQNLRSGLAAFRGDLASLFNSRRRRVRQQGHSPKRSSRTELSRGFTEPFVEKVSVVVDDISASLDGISSKTYIEDEAFPSQGSRVSSLWTAARSFKCCKQGEESLFEDRVKRADIFEAISVEAVVSQLNSGSRECTDEFCIVFVKTSKAYHVLFKAGKKHVAMESLGMVNRMHGTLSVRIIAAYNLRNTDSGVFGDVSDPFVVVQFGEEEHKTKRINNNLNPVWNAEAFRFHVDIAQQQSQILQLEVFDHNNYRPNKSLGSFAIDVRALDLTSYAVSRKREKLVNGDKGEIDFEISFCPGHQSEVLSEPVEELKLALKRQYGSVITICMLGGESFACTDTEEIVREVANALHTNFANEAIFVTEGAHGAQETFAKHYGNGSRVWNLRSETAEGKDIFAGEDFEERKVIFGMLGDIYITAEGGPATAKEASAALGRGACVVPLIRTGGASAGMFGFPAEALERQEHATDEQWAALKDKTAPPAVTAAAVTTIVSSYLDARGLRRQQPGSSDTPSEETPIQAPLSPSSKKDLKAEIRLLEGEIKRYSIESNEEVTPKPPAKGIGISGVGRLEIASPVSSRDQREEFSAFGGKAELRALIVEYARTEVPGLCPESIQDIWLNSQCADSAQIGVMYLPLESSGAHRMEHRQFCLEKEKQFAYPSKQAGWRVVKALQPKDQEKTPSPSKALQPKDQEKTPSPSKSPKRKAPPPLDDSLTGPSTIENQITQSVEERDDDDDASSLAEAMKHCIEITDAAKTPRALFANFAAVGASSNLMISRETFAQLVAMYGGRSPAAAGGEKLAASLFDSLSVCGPEGIFEVPYDIFCAEFCPTRAHDAILRLQSKRNALIRDLQAAVSASCLPSSCVISAMVGDKALDEKHFNTMVSKVLSESSQPRPDPVATKALWCELVRGRESRVMPQQMSQLLAGQCTSLNTAMPRSSPRAAPAPLDVELAADDQTVVQEFGRTDGVANSNDVAAHFAVRDAMRFGVTLDSRSPRDLFDTVSTSSGGAGSALTISRDDFVPFAARLGGGNALHAPAPSLDVGSVSTDSASHLLFEYLAIKDANGDSGVHYEIFVTQICPEAAPDVVAKSTKMQKALFRDLRSAIKSASREPEMRVEKLVGEGSLDEDMFNTTVKKILQTSLGASSHGPVAMKLAWLHLVRDRLQPDCRLNSHELIKMLTAKESGAILVHSNSLELSSDDDSSMELSQTVQELVIDDITPFATPQHDKIANAKLSRDFVTSLEKAVEEATEEYALQEEPASTKTGDASQSKVKLTNGSQMAGQKYKGGAIGRRKIERSVRVTERKHGTTHPEVAHALLSLASHHEKEGSLDDHQTHIDRAMSIYSQSFGLDSSSLIDGLSKHAGIVRERGDHDVEQLLLKRIQHIEENAVKNIEEHARKAGLSGNGYDRYEIRQRNKDRIKDKEASEKLLSPSNLSASMLLSDASSSCGASVTLKEALNASLISPSSEKQVKFSEVLLESSLSLSTSVAREIHEQQEQHEPLQCTAKHHIGQCLATITAEKGVFIERVLEAKAFQEWVHLVAKERRFTVTNVHIQSVDMDGSKVGTLKFKAEATVDGKSIPGIVFASGQEAAVLVLIHHQSKDFALVVRQPRVPISLCNFAQIPVGTVDNNGFFSGCVAEKIKVDLGLNLNRNDFLNMTQVAYEDTHPGIYPSCGASFEHSRIFLYQKLVSTDELNELRRKISRTAEEGETFKYELIPFGTLWKASPDAKTLAALTLYGKLKLSGIIQPMKAFQSIAWNSERSIDICDIGEEELFEGKVKLLDKDMASSKKMAIQCLNHGELECEDGYCIVLDIAAGKYYLLYRSGKRDAALACFGLKDSTKGKVTLTIHGATNLKNVDSGILGDVSDPFLVARISLEERRTETIDNDLNPVWKTNVFEYHDRDLNNIDENVVLLEVFDHNNFRKNKSLGTATVDLSSLEPDVTKELTLHLRDGEGAELSLSVRFSPEQEEIPQTIIPALVPEKAEPAQAPEAKEAKKLVGISPLFRPKDLTKVFADADSDNDGILGNTDLSMYLGDFLCYGRAEIEAFRKEFGDDRGVSLDGLQKGVKKLNPYALTKSSGRLFVRKPGAFGGHNGVSVALEDLVDCTVLICERTCQITADNVVNCKVLLGACSEAIFLRNCENCTFWTACKQFRTRDCKNCDFYLHSGTEPVIESSENLRFAPFSAEYPGLTRHFEEAKLVANRNFWSAIFDFSRKSQSDPSNWSILPFDECKNLVVSWGSGETADTPSPTLTQELLVAKPLVSEEGHGQSIANIPQTRPSPPPAPTRNTCRQRCITDEADSLREGAIRVEPQAEASEAIANNQTPVVACLDTSKASSALDDDIEIELLDESDSERPPPKSGKTFSAYNDILRKGNDDDDNDKSEFRASPNHGKGLSRLAKMAAGASDDSDDDDLLPLGRIPGRSGPAKAKSPANVSLLKKAISGRDDSDSDEIVLPRSKAKPAAKPGETIRNAMGSWHKAGRRSESDSSDSDGLDAYNRSAASRGRGQQRQ